MEKEKNRMQIRPDFGKDAGAWRKGRQEGLIASAEGRRAVKRNKKSLSLSGAVRSVKLFLNRKPMVSWRQRPSPILQRMVSRSLLHTATARSPAWYTQP